MNVKMIYFLCQAAEAAEPLSPDEARWRELMLWTGILVIFMVMGAIVFKWAKKKFSGAMEDEVANQELTLYDLRRLLQEGQLTQEEFDKAKELIIQQTRMRASPPGKADRASHQPGSPMTNMLYLQGTLPLDGADTPPPPPPDSGNSFGKGGDTNMGGGGGLDGGDGGGGGVN